MQLLHSSRRKNSVIRHYFYELKQFAKLCNALIHEYVSEGKYIAYPSEEVVSEIETISNKLCFPPSAMSLATSPVQSFKVEDSLNLILPYFKKQGVSQFPIYEKDQCRGLLTEGGILNWMNENIVNLVINISSAKVKDVLPLEKGA